MAPATAQTTARGHLILQRGINEEVVIEVGGELIVVQVLRVLDYGVKLGFRAGPNVKVHRREVYNAIQRGELRT